MMLFYLRQLGRTNPLSQKNIKFNFHINKFILFSFIITLMNFDFNLNQRTFSFNYSVELEPSDGKKLELWLPVPQSNEVQIISNLNVDSAGLKYQIKDEKDHGNKYLYVFSELGINEVKTITMTFDVLRQEHQNINYSKINSKKYLSASMMVPTGKIFKSIIDKNKLNKNDMKSVYDFVLSGMHYGKPTGDKDNPNYKYVNGGINKNTGKEWLPKDITYGRLKVTQDMLVEKQNKKESYAYGNGNSLYACDIGVGNCTDYHSYFISLSRTLDVPARFHMGFSIPNEEEGKVGGYHCWADYYVDGEGWSPVDISEADKAPEKAEYFSSTVCENRVEMMVGRDFVLENSNQGPINLFVYPLLEIDDKKSTTFKKYFTYKNI